MARVTVEDCILRVPNRFELVMMSAERARNLGAGAPLAVDRDRDKNPVVALREIAEEKVSCEELRNLLIKGHQKSIAPDHPEDDVTEVMAEEQGWLQRQQAEGEGHDPEDNMDDDEEEIDAEVTEEGVESDQTPTDV